VSRQPPPRQSEKRSRIGMGLVLYVVLWVAALVAVLYLVTH